MHSRCKKLSDQQNNHSYTSRRSFLLVCLIPARNLHSERSAAIWQSRPRCESATQFSSSLHGMIGTGFCSLVAPVVGNDNSSVRIRFLAVDAQPTAASLRCGARKKLSLQPATNECKKSSAEVPPGCSSFPHTEVRVGGSSWIDQELDDLRSILF